MRQSIPHITTAKALQTMQAIAVDGLVLASTTEKTDGSFFRLTYADGHYYCETQGCGPFNIFYDNILEWAEKRFGERFNPDVMRPFEAARIALQKSELLLDTLKDVKEIRGELISAHAPKLDYYHVCPVGTAYAREHLGKDGLFVIHRHDNPWLTRVGYDARALSTDLIRVDDDWAPPIEIHMTNVDTPEKLYSMVATCFAYRPGKWGDEVEGYVIHSNGHRFKWIDPNWKERKESRWQKSI